MDGEVELARLARKDGQHFDCATWLHKVREMLKENFQEGRLTGRNSNRLN